MGKIFRNPDVMWRVEEQTLEEACAAIDRGEDIEDMGTSVLFSGGTMLSLNYLGTEIWKICDGMELDAIVSVLLQQFEVEVDILREDVRQFIEELAGKGFISYGE